MIGKAKYSVSLCDMKVKMLVAQLYLILCDPMDSSVHGISQARILEQVAIALSRGSS